MLIQLKIYLINKWRHLFGILDFCLMLGTPWQLMVGNRSFCNILSSSWEQYWFLYLNNMLFLPRKAGLLFLFLPWCQSPKNEGGETNKHKIKTARILPTLQIWEALKNKYEVSIHSKEIWNAEVLDPNSKWEESFQNCSVMLCVLSFLKAF